MRIADTRAVPCLFVAIVLLECTDALASDAKLRAHLGDAAILYLMIVFWTAAVIAHYRWAWATFTLACGVGALSSLWDWRGIIPLMANLLLVALLISRQMRPAGRPSQDS
jgi:hypothetical protein